MRVPPPLWRIHSPMNGLCLSHPESLSTAASSGAQASPFAPASRPSMTSGNAMGSHRASRQDLSQYLGTVCTPDACSADPNEDFASPSVVQQCRTDIPHQTVHSGLPSTSTSSGDCRAGQSDPLPRRAALCLAATRDRDQGLQQDLGAQHANVEAATEVMPLYAFPCAPAIAFQPVQDTSAFVGLLQPQVCVLDPFVKPGTCSVADVSRAKSFQKLEIGCPVLPSLGSAGHHRGSCKPCAFGSERCRNGANCEFCHICKPIEKSKRGRWILKRRKQAQELQTEVSDLQSILRINFDQTTCVGMA